jgi:hypothetical protein
LDYHIFENVFLDFYREDIQEFYGEESTRLAGERTSDERSARKAAKAKALLSPQDFVNHCAERVEAEKLRAKTVFDAHVAWVEEIVQEVERTLLEGRLQWLSQSWSFQSSFV